MDREKVKREIKNNKPSECVNVDLIVVMFCDNSGSYKRDTDQAVCNMVSLELISGVFPVNVES